MAKLQLCNSQSGSQLAWSWVQIVELCNGFHYWGGINKDVQQFMCL